MNKPQYFITAHEKTALEKVALDIELALMFGDGTRDLQNRIDLLRKANMDALVDGVIGLKLWIRVDRLINTRDGDNLKLATNILKAQYDGDV